MSGVTPDLRPRPGMAPCIYENDKVIIRAEHKGEEFVVYVHRKEENLECIPLGYMLGNGCLHFRTTRP